MFNINREYSYKFFLILLISVLATSYFVNKDVVNKVKVDNTKNIQDLKKDKEDKEEKTRELESFSSNLPIIIIDTKGELINGDNRINANLKIYDADKKLDYENEALVNNITDKPKFESDISIKIRGNSTRLLPKKQYSLKLINSSGEKEEKKILGMEKESDWVLSAPFEDKSCMRDPFSYYISRKLMEFAPDTRYCEVFVIDDGADTLFDIDYKGLYIMIENIKRGKARVDIPKNIATDEDISFIVAKNIAKETDVKIQNYGAETYIYDYNLILEYPQNDITKKQKNDINRYMSEFERVLYSDKYDVIDEGYKNYINVDSFVDYYLINEFFRNTDAGFVSTYIYKGYGEKIKAGPVWDFNTSMGNGDGLSPFNDYTGFYMASRDWFDRLLEDINFVTKVVNRYKSLRNTFLSTDYLIDYIDKTAIYIRDAAIRNFEKWPIDIINQSSLFTEINSNLAERFGDDMIAVEKYFNENPNLLRDTSDRSKTFDEEIEMLKIFIINRGVWLDENIDSLYKWVD